MFRILFFLIVFFGIVNAKYQITQEWLDTKPRSIAKDFYIWRYLNQNITSNEAVKVLGQARYVNNKLFFRYARKFNHQETLEVARCMKLNAKKLVNTSANCIEVGMSTFKATSLNDNELDTIISKLMNKYPNSAKRFEILNATLPFTKLISSSKDVFFDTFNQCGGKFRINNFNYTLPLSTIKRLRGDKRFTQTIKLIVTTPKLTKIQKSILFIDATNLNHKITFNLAINAIRHNEILQALKYLAFSYKNAYFQQDKDKVLFWQYKLTNNQLILNKLASSWDNNIYSMQAFEEKNIEPKNITYIIENNQTNQSYYSYKDPFSWLPILNNSRKMTQKKMDKYEKLFNQKETLGHLAFVKERFFRYKKTYFITPYTNILNDMPLTRQTLIYAIARQESRFIQTSISSAYAMGVMQIMPFLSKAIAKELKEVYDIDKQLDPKVNLKYANHHLNFLEKQLNHPLFIAYAYNGGIGFIKRMFKNGLFQDGKYEPFLSMEMIPYDETKKYGKKVLANYFIYYNYLNPQNKIKLSTLLQKIKSPSQI